MNFNRLEENSARLQVLQDKFNDLRGLYFFSVLTKEEAQAEWWVLVNQARQLIGLQPLPWNDAILREMVVAMERIPD